MSDRPHVWIDPGRMGGTPCLSGRRLPTESVATVTWTRGMAEACSCWDLSRSEVLVACWYEWRHRNSEKPRGRWAKRAFPLLWKGDYDAVPDPPVKP